MILLPFIGEPSERSEPWLYPRSLVNLANVAHYAYIFHNVSGEPSEPGEPCWTFSSSGNTSKFEDYTIRYKDGNYNVVNEK